MIEEYHYGSIIINGKTYNYDIETRWTGEILKWWRGESHIIDEEDVKRAIDQDPDIIVIGTGESGTAQVTEQAKEAIKSKGIELIVDLTEQATKTFNIINEESEEEEGEQRKVIGLFHLTC
ncbi:hypothetical protein IH779_00115 [Patescibacteria group bacterium]|nr:hypothetical protein [Patescibacteria group bacterium]